MFTLRVVLHIDSVFNQGSPESRCNYQCLCVFILECAKTFHFLLLSAFPTNPIIKSSGPSLVGEMIKLTCVVQEVFPANHFQILWLDGERVKHLESGSFSSGATNLTSVYSYRIDRNDQGKLITCKVLLDIHVVLLPQVVKTASTTLSVHCKSRLFLCSFQI